MKNSTIWRAMCALFTALFCAPMREFKVTAIGQLQAKSGTITAGGGSNAELEAAVAQSDPKVATLAQTAIDALSESAAEKKVTIATSNRKVRVFSSAADLAATFAVQDCVKAGTITKDDLTKSSSTMTVADPVGDVGDALSAIVGEQKPSLSVATLISKIEDSLDAMEGDVEAVILVNQPDNELEVWTGTAANVGFLDAALAGGFVEEAIFTQTITTGPTERPFGE